MIHFPLHTLVASLYSIISSVAAYTITILPSSWLGSGSGYCHFLASNVSSGSLASSGGIATHIGSCKSMPTTESASAHSSQITAMPSTGPRLTYRTSHRTLPTAIQHHAGPVTFGTVVVPWHATCSGERHALAQHHLPEEPGGASIAGPRVGQVLQPLPDVSRVCGIHGLDFAQGFVRAVEADLR